VVTTVVIYDRTEVRTRGGRRREALRAEGEHVHLLRPLETPPSGAELTAVEALASPAVQLFMQRAVASGHRLPLSDGDANIVADVCSRLDGIPLAIELAASHARGAPQSLTVARQQSALGWELRSAIALAPLWAGHERADAAKEVLRDCYQRFTEGSATADLKMAAQLLEQLGPPTNA
jgi:predicted ATPase